MYKELLKHIFNLIHADFSIDLSLIFPLGFKSELIKLINQLT